MLTIINVIRVKNYEDMSQKAAEILLTDIKANPKTVLGLATGSTPLGLYKLLIKDHLINKTSYKDIQTVNLDEYIELSPDHPQSYRYFMNHQLFNHIDIPLDQTNIPNSNAKSLKEECLRYDLLIKAVGGIDVQVLGIGNNGHIGFNEPGTSFNSRTHIVQLAESTRRANSRFFGSLDKVPKQAMTMGIETILESKKILLLASGESKRDAMRRLLTEEPNENFPASSLRFHSNVCIIADEEALQDIKTDFSVNVRQTNR
jgi:glucosamine-6-phosphate deaminase